MKEIEENKINGNTFLKLINEKTYHWQDHNTSQSSLNIHYNPYKKSQWHFLQKWKSLILTFKWNLKVPQITKRILKKNKMENSHVLISKLTTKLP